MSNLNELKEYVFSGKYRAALIRIECGNLMYSLLGANVSGVEDSSLDFVIPYADIAGGTFELHDDPKFFMRWIRKALEEKKLIEKAIAEHREQSRETD